MVVLAATAAFSQVINDVKTATAQRDFLASETVVSRYHAAQGNTPELAEAVSWEARGALNAGEYERALNYAKQTRHLVAEQLPRHPLDSEEHLATALGAAIEVEAQALARQGQREQAVNLLKHELRTYGATSIAARIQKNIHLLSLEGQPAPALHAREHLGPAPKPLAALHGHPVLLFFWAHWCGDCKYESRQIAQVKTELQPKGLAVVAPTQRYGYAAGGEDAAPAQELEYMEAIRQKYYNGLLDVPVPVSEENMKNYGVSTTPTIVLLDRRGIVRMYHPGRMTAQELREQVAKLL